MKGLDAELVVVVHELKNMAERRQGPTEVAKALDQVNWEEFAEKKNLKRKAEEDEASRRRVVSEPTHKRARSASEEAQPTKKRSRSESPESDDGTPPPSKRHCSLPTMSLSTPQELTHWKTSAWVPPAQVSLNTFNYDRYAVPVLVDDESEDGSEGGSVGRECLFSFLLVSFCTTVCCCGGKEWMDFAFGGLYPSSAFSVPSLFPIENWIWKPAPLLSFHIRMEASAQTPFVSILLSLVHAN